MEFFGISEGTLRLGLFLSLLLIFSALEWRYPKLQRPAHRKQRWAQHLGITVLNTLLLRILFPVLALDLALNPPVSWGLMHLVNWPFWLEALLAIVFFDAFIYWQHRVFHRVPWLWRLHRMHHSDLLLDASSALRFHPIEIAISMALKMGVVVAIGASPWAVIIFEILLNGTALFNHANWNLKNWDSKLKTIVVTPDMHRVHHSSVVEETNSNYGFCLSVWDKWFGSFKDRPDPDEIGLKEFRKDREQKFSELLIQPLR